jgi:hypothetical protein
VVSNQVNITSTLSGIDYHVIYGEELYKQNASRCNNWSKTVTGHRLLKDLYTNELKAIICLDNNNANSLWKLNKSVHTHIHTMTNMPASNTCKWSGNYTIKNDTINYMILFQNAWVLISIWFMYIQICQQIYSAILFTDLAFKCMKQQLQKDIQKTELH